jgi:hypothetical protein
MIRYLLFCFLVLPFFVLAQVSSELKGKIVSETSNLDGIHVINLSQNIGAVTSIGGYFVIKAAVSDTLIFSAVYLKAERHIVKKEDFGENLLFIKLVSLVNNLDEISVIQYKNITPQALGIVPYGQKTYTPAERKLYTATGGGNRYGLSTSVSLDGIINGISGRTKMLKKEIVVERKEILLESLSLDFDEKYFTESLNIPKIYIQGFLYYVVENERFLKIYTPDNKTAIEFLLTELSVEYLKLLPKYNLDEKDNKEELLHLQNEK